MYLQTDAVACGVYELLAIAGPLYYIPCSGIDGACPYARARFRLGGCLRPEHYVVYFLLFRGRPDAERPCNIGTIPFVHRPYVDDNEFSDPYPPFRRAEMRLGRIRTRCNDAVEREPFCA